MSVTLERVRIAFIDNLWAPGGIPGIPSSPPSYSCRFIIEPGSENDNRLKTAIKAAALAKFKGQAEDILEEIKFNKNCNCYMPGNRFRKKDGGQVYNGFEGKNSLTAKRGATYGPPLVIDRQGNPVAQTSGVIYSGCYVDALVEPFAYQGKPNSGISCGLLTVRFRESRESFGGAGTPTTAGLPAVEDTGFDDDDNPF
jgi:hypothetical protein